MSLLITPRIIRYFFVGGVAAFVDLALFFLFAQLGGLHYLLVSPFSFLAATLVNYVLSIRFVFSSGIRFQKRVEIFMVLFVSVVGLLINQGFLFIGVAALGLPLMYAKVLATAGVFLWNYMLRSRFIFSP